jgi:hypothetical protein
VNWVDLAYNSDTTVPMGDFAGLSPWRATSGQVPPYPVPSNARDEATPVRRERSAATVAVRTGPDDDLREELRRIIIEELHDMIGGGHGG